MHASVERETSEPVLPEQPSRSWNESWWKWTRRHAKNIWESTAAGLKAMHPDQNEESAEKPETPRASTPSFSREIHFDHTTQPSVPAEEPSRHEVEFPTNVLKPSRNEAERTPVKNRSSQSWVESLKQLFNFYPDLAPDEGDWDFGISDVSEQDLKNVSDDSEKNKIKPCKLTEASHAKIAKIDSWLNSWTFLPIKTAMRLVFPVDKLADLVKELNSTGMIPADIGQRIEDITKDIRLLPTGAKKVANVLAMSRVISTKEVLNYASEVLPSLSGLAHASVDIELAKKVLDKYPNDPVRALREIHELGLKTMEKVPFDKILKAVDGKTKAVDKTKKINGIITTVAVILFALALGSLVLSIIEGVTENKTVRKIMEAIMILDLAAVLGGIGYGAVRLGHALNKKGANPQSAELDGSGADAEGGVEAF